MRLVVNVWYLLYYGFFPGGTPYDIMTYTGWDFISFFVIYSYFNKDSVFTADKSSKVWQ